MTRAVTPRTAPIRTTTVRLTLPVATLLLGALPLAAQQYSFGPANADFKPGFEGQTRAAAPMDDTQVTPVAETVVDGLVHPWGIAVLPDDSYLVTERAGRLRRITAEGDLSEPITGVPEVVAEGQGGMLDVALAPDFAESRVVYLTYAKPMGDGLSATAAARAVLSENMTSLTELTDIFVQDPPSPTTKHYGSRIVPDGDHVWITTGEHSSMAERDNAQQLDMSYGKVIRVTPEGDAPDDNPFVSDEAAIATIYTLGHRNIQGAALDPETGKLWTLEHGPKGGDELNLIEPGLNYGWPVVSYGIRYSGDPVGSGKARAEGFAEPRYYWDPVIAPGGFTFYEGDMFAGWEGDVIAASLNPGGLVRLQMEGTNVTGEARYLGDLGRVRDIEIAPDGAILALTDKENGALIRITPEG